MTRRGSSCSADEPRSSWAGTARSAAVVALVLLATAMFSPAVAAESPVEVAEALLVDGVYVAPGREDVDPAGLAATVQQARARGLRLVIVAPIDPQPDARAFARRIQEAADADAAIVFELGGGVEADVVDEFESARLRAVTAARSKATPADAVEAFTEELLTEPSRSLPPIVGQTVTAVVGLAVVLAGAVALEQSLRRVRRSWQGRREDSSERANTAA